MKHKTTVQHRILRVIFFISVQAFWVYALAAQPFAPAAGWPGSDAIAADDPRIGSWAHSVVELKRGFQNIALPDSGFVSVGEPSQALGPALQNGVVSLGDGGSITLSFNPPVRNGNGPDFAVFENSFSDDFLELAFVAVSSNGVDFFTFPAESLTDTATQVNAFGSVDARNLHNLAGKYRSGFGTPFDIEALPLDEKLNPEQIRFVRITDVVGSILGGYATRDSKGRIINDPYPTPYSSGGFDVDAVGAIHVATASAEVQIKANLVGFGMPVSIQSQSPFQYAFIDHTGRQVLNGAGVPGENLITFHAYTGIYWLTIQTETGRYQFKLCVL